MFQKILIANRGEIACRIIKTARRLRIATVAVYSDADADALHVRMADEAVHIGPAGASESYLVIEKIVEACRKTGAEAVHPGYGFLSERAAFPRALEAAGIVFIGPNPHAIDAMGDKIESKKAALAAGVSTVPGHAGVIGDAEEAVRIAEEIGYPVMIKASAGGGGKGMRIAHDAPQTREGFARARSEAASSFGDDRVFVEKFIENPRHIEIQVLGDKHGQVAHLFERECSVQRRNQKVVEEAPSPLLDEEMRARMGAQAVALAKAVGYDSAGTVEFVVGQDRRFYFLEMNTRLQVEHPVTELVTGIDLVEEMIRVAAGERMRFAQADLSLNGWAVEARIYAEDPVRGFLPSAGRVAVYERPVEVASDGASLRIDDGIAPGGEITAHYDPMIGKLVAHARTREAAVEAMAKALDGFAIEGIAHNLPFLSAIMAHPRWREGRLSTGFIAEEYPDGFDAAPSPEEARLCALLAVAATALAEPGVALPRDLVARRGEACLDVRCEGSGGSLRLSGDGFDVALSTEWHPGEAVLRADLDGRQVAAAIARLDHGWRLTRGGVIAAFGVLEPRHDALLSRMPDATGGGEARLVRSPASGLLVQILVEPGGTVEEGEPLAVIEAMKMESTIPAPRAGRVAAILVAPGKVLEAGETLIELD